MSLNNLKNNPLPFNIDDFGDNFFLGMSSIEFGLTGNIENKSFLNTKDQYSNTDISFYTAEFEKLKKEIELIKQLGLLNFKFSLSWSRILPNGSGKINNEAIDFYHDILDICIENGIEPFVSLYDSYLPTELEKEGGWSNRKILDWFENYVEICINTFKEKVTYWIIFNEASLFSGISNFFGLYPFGKKKIDNFLPALHHALLCQSIVFKMIKKTVLKAQVGTFFSCNYIIAMTYSEKDLKAVERIDALLNRIFIEPSLGLGYPIDTLPFLKSISKYIIDGDDDLIKVEFDFIGLQNCTREIVCHNSLIPYLNAKILQNDKLSKKNDHLSLEIYNKLIYFIIKKYSKYEGVKKIIIVENITSLSRKVDLCPPLGIQKILSIPSFSQQILNANRNGGKVFGYFISSYNDLVNSIK
jgi:beta-glucosidase